MGVVSPMETIQENSINKTSEAHTYLGQCHFYGHHTRINVIQAANFYELAASQGYFKAQVLLGECYEHGMGRPINWKQAVHLYKLASDQACPIAQCKLGECYEKGLLGLKKDLGEAIKFYKLAINQGNLEAQYLLGMIYLSNVKYNTEDIIFKLATDKACRQAVNLLEMSAKQGHSKAAHELGKMKNVF